MPGLISTKKNMYDGGPFKEQGTGAKMSAVCGQSRAAAGRTFRKW